jgi:hypothetical protein
LRYQKHYDGTIEGGHNLSDYRRLALGLSILNTVLSDFGKGAAAGIGVPIAIPIGVSVDVSLLIAIIGSIETSECRSTNCPN